jgi:hypothetical protein
LRRILQTRIERDTLIGSRPAVLISIRSTFRAEASASNPRAEYNADVVLDGTETGFAVVSRNGALLQRWRTGEAHGRTTYKGRGAQVAVPQTYTYRSMISAIEK